MLLFEFFVNEDNMKLFILPCMIMTIHVTISACRAFKDTLSDVLIYLSVPCDQLTLFEKGNKLLHIPRGSLDIGHRLTMTS